MSMLLTGVNRQRWNPRKVDGLAQWLSEVDGPWLRDRSRLGDDRILNGGPGLQSGRCYTFDGSTAYVALNTTLRDIVGANGTWSIAWWMKPTLTGSAVAVFDSTNGSSNRVQCEVAGSPGSGVLRASTYDGAFSNVSGTVANATWVHCVLTCNGGVLAMYLDGVAQVGTTGATTTAGTVFNIGRNSSSAAYFTGNMFRFHVFSDVLTTDEISWIYSFGEAGTDPGTANLVALFKMDEQAGPIAYNAAGGSNNGMIAGTLANVHGSTQNVYSFQNEDGYSNATHFSGTNAYADFGTDASLNIAAGNAFSFTMEIVLYSTGSYYIIDKQGATNGYYVRTSGGSVYVGLPDGAGWNEQTIAAGLVAGVPYHISIVWSGTGLNVYVYDISAGTNTTYVSSVSKTLQNSTANLVIGRWDPGPSIYLQATLRDVKLYNDVLLADEVAYLQTNGASGDDPGTANLFLDVDFRSETLTDNSGNGNNGTAYNLALVYLPRDESDTANDVLGNPLGYTGPAPRHGQLLSPCGTLDGVNDYLIHDAISMAGDYTVSTLVRRDGGNNYMLWGGGDASGGADYRGYFWYYNSNGAFWLRHYNEGVGATWTRALYPDQTWVRVTIRRSGTSIKMFWDGVEVESATEASPAVLTLRTIGNSYNYTSYGLQGNLADHRVYSRALTDAEILGLENSEEPATTDLEGHWPMCEKAGAIIHDVSGNGRHATAINVSLASFWANTQPVFAHGCAVGYSGAWVFDGNTDRLTSTLTPASTGWVACRFRTTSNTNQSLVGFADGTDAHGIYYWGAEANKYIGINTWNNDSYGIVGTGLVDDGEEHHLIAYLDWSDFTNSRLWLDGAEQVISQVKGTSTNRTIGSHVFKVPYSTDPAQQMLNGTVRDVYAANGAAPTADEVSWLNSSGTTGSAPAFDLGWDLSTSSVVDSSGNDYSATVAGDATLVYLPRDESDTDNDVLGSALSHPPGFNGASDLDHDPFTIPALDSGNLDGMTPPSAHALGDASVDAAQHFFRNETTYEDRFLLFSDPLTGADLAKTQAYVS